MTYSIVSGNGAGKFAVDRTSGVITLVGALDFENLVTYTLTVHTIDRGTPARTATATVSLTVSDVNDVTPSCTSSLYTGTVPENAVTNTVVATVVCTDGDLSVGNTVTYSITSAHTEFIVDSTSGAVKVNAALDMETTQTYDLTVQASDGTFSTTVTVRVAVTNVNDMTPVFNPSGPYTKTIAENIAVGSTVFDLNAADADFGTTTFTFSITAGNTAGKFYIGATSGIIQTASTIDRDSPLVATYTLTLEVADGTGAGSRTATTSIVVTVSDENDNFPSCDAAVYSTTVAENASPGTLLISPVCSDLDVVASPTLLYTVTSGDGGNLFLINTGTGALSLQGTLDYETAVKFTLTVTVNDQGTTAKTTTLTMVIYVSPVNEFIPVFTGIPYTSSVPENRALGTVVVTISATDGDTGSTHGSVRYAIKSGNTEGRFSINSRTGTIVVAGTLDREATPSYGLTVTAADMIDGDATAKTAENTFTVTITDTNDNYPEINPPSYSVTVNENAIIGASIVRVSATDDDEGIAGTTGLQYSITAGNTGNMFAVSGSWLTLAGDLDAGTTSLYTLTVKVADQGTPVRSSNTLVTIQVVAVNEFPPIFSSPTDVSISESTPVGSSIDQIAASDDDTGEFGVLRYYLRRATLGNIGEDRKSVV